MPSASASPLGANSAPKKSSQCGVELHDDGPRLVEDGRHRVDHEAEAPPGSQLAEHVDVDADHGGDGLGQVGVLCALDSNQQSLTAVDLAKGHNDVGAIRERLDDRFEVGLWEEVGAVAQVPRLKPRDEGGNQEAGGVAPVHLRQSTSGAPIIVEMQCGV
eukprot:scaffold49361_cov292-Isochrysis_galbana.AAC.6